MTNTSFDNSTIVVGVAGGIAAYKSCHVVRGFKEDGANVVVVPTSAALNFVGKATFEALSGNPVSTTVFDAVDEVRHVNVGQHADLIVVAPATADLIARVAMGRADDLLTATLLVATCPIVLVPAMHTEMWSNAATRENVATLRRRGIIVMDPAHGRLTGADTGPGRLPDSDQIIDFAKTVARTKVMPRDLVGKKVLISAGGTQENIDPVRYVGNRSSGRQGFALAEIASQRGAEVTVVAGATDKLPVPCGARVVNVTSAVEMQRECMREARNSDVVIMAAAVADFRPREIASAKMKKGTADSSLQVISMVENPDILRGLVEQRQGEKPVIVGFAAETRDANHTPLEFARQKLNRKKCDLLMCNEVGVDKVFGKADNSGYLLSRQGNVEEISQGSKHWIAFNILNHVVRLLEAEM